MSEPQRSRSWVSQPEMSDASIRDATGRGWDEWCDLIDDGPGRDAGHSAIARWVAEEHGLDGWWSQGVTVSYERIRGLRLPYQRADGSFAVSCTKVMAIDVDEVRARLHDDAARAEFLDGLDTECRSKPSSKNVRLTVGNDDGSVEMAMTGRPDGRVMVAVEHSRLGSPGDVERWRALWTAWLKELAGG